MGSVSGVAERRDSETTAVSSVRKTYGADLSDETVASRPVPPFLPTATRIPCTEALLTGRGWGARRGAPMVSILLWSAGTWHGGAEGRGRVSRRYASVVLAWRAAAARLRRQA